ncbi:uncharacterized protein LOC111303320 [Durio zibethinus]|uniref:Uncharacterized protein LOC111303320 n=1 Tax=Durio zibethinus TaxID=66656 RepID=A0A6P5ZQU8_DURZI|nr:uncharacterized protein LOC111303320 [Durio zibethinus]
MGGQSLKGLFNEDTVAIHIIDGLVMLYVSKMIPDFDKDRFYASGHVSFGKFSIALKVKSMSPNYAPSENKNLDVKGTGCLWMTIERLKVRNVLSKEEHINVLHISALQLIGLLLEPNDALEELESKVNPLSRKAKRGKIFLEVGIPYLEVK